MKNLKVFLLAMVLVLSITGISGAVQTMVYDGGFGTGIWSDVNKANVFGAPDSLMCWAATASNSLAWTGWKGWDSGTSSYISTAAAIYSVFDAGWTNRTGNAIYAYEWWMTDHTTANSNFGEVLDSQGKNFYPGVVSDPHLAGSVDNFVQDNPAPDDIYTWLNTYINAHRAIVARIEVPAGDGTGSYAHSLSIWGWDTANSRIYFTDPDDGGVGTLRDLAFHTASDHFYIDDYTNLYTTVRDVMITEISRLNINGPPAIEPNKPTGPDGQIPEPTTILLIGSGLIGLWGFRKKFKK
jgi:hypothetical protein